MNALCIWPLLFYTLYQIQRRLKYSIDARHCTITEMGENILVWFHETIRKYFPPFERIIWLVIAIPFINFVSLNRSR